MIDTNIIISLICSTVGIIIGFILRKSFERKLNYDIKKDELILNNKIDHLKDKLEIYWSIYFKLLICQSVNMQNKTIKDNNQNILINKDTIIKNLDEILNIISNNIHKMNIDETLLDLILRFITHVSIFRNIYNSKIEYPFPDQFTLEITSRTFKYQQQYDNYINNIHNVLNNNIIINETIDTNINLQFNDKIKKIHNQILLTSNIQLYNSSNSLIFDDDDIDLVCNPEDIDLLAIFDNSNKESIINFNL